MATSETTEKALETIIEEWLVERESYVKGRPSDFDPAYAVDKAQLFAFLKASQPDLWERLSAKSEFERVLLDRLSKKIRQDGVLDVLKKGLKLDELSLTLYFRAPSSGLNPEAEIAFASNIFSITRQIHYAGDDKSVDMVLFVNGLPVATFELKNPWTGQTVRDAVRQYQRTRDPRLPLFSFGYCFVHFAIDPNEAYMTGELAGEDTWFLPFNRGRDHGRGNPPYPGSHRTAYVWREVLPKRSLAEIIERFAKLVEELDEETGRTVKRLVFPRYHQLTAVRELVADAKKTGIGRRYLIQHSAGSGKSNSISWVAFQLAELFDASGEKSVFDSVVIVTDRIALDDQLGRNVKSFAELSKLVQSTEKGSWQLRQALEAGKKIIITTLQKFPHVAGEITQLADRRFAVIIDEAHSSQGGLSAAKMNQALGNAEEDGSGDDRPDFAELVLEAAEQRRLSRNVSFFAFTATPKRSTLEKFGTKQKDGSFKPFHLYSMKQAIEEGFILDVLRNYVTYKSYYEITKTVAENPLFDNVRAQRRLRAFVEGHEATIKVKAQIMMDHFIEQVVLPKKLRGRARAMVVTSGIVHAIRYYQAINAYLAEQNAPFRPLIAFSGKKTVDGIEHTEDSVNGFPGKDVPKEFRKDAYRILVVADKYQTGFDEPLLCAMYVDKRLDGVQAVQTLSRLNRAKRGKKPEDVAVLDFYNTAEDIKAAFDDFYTTTLLSGPTDVNLLHDLAEKLSDAGIYDHDKIEQFTALYFRGAPAEQLSPTLDQVIARFDSELEEDAKVEFKIRAKTFVRLYAQLASIIGFANAEWEKLYWFLKLLIPGLKVNTGEEGQLKQLLDSVDLGTYGLERSKVGSIKLDAAEKVLDPIDPKNPGGIREPERDPLDYIIRKFNETYFAGWAATAEDKRVKLISLAKKVFADPRFASQVATTHDEQNRRIAILKLIEEKVGDARRAEMELYKLYATSPEFKTALNQGVLRVIDEPGRFGIDKPDSPQ